MSVSWPEGERLRAAFSASRAGIPVAMGRPTTDEDRPLDDGAADERAAADPLAALAALLAALVAAVAALTAAAAAAASALARWDAPALCRGGGGGLCMTGLCNGLFAGLGFRLEE